MPDQTLSPGLAAVVLAWLPKLVTDAAEVLNVDARGYDWVGDTETGFHEEFTVDIQYVSHIGARRRVAVKGSDLESLWAAVTARP